VGLPACRPAGGGVVVLSRRMAHYGFVQLKPPRCTTYPVFLDAGLQRLALQIPTCTGEGGRGGRSEGRAPPPMHSPLHHNHITTPPPLRTPTLLPPSHRPQLTRPLLNPPSLNISLPPPLTSTPPTTLRLPDHPSSILTTSSSPVSSRKQQAARKSAAAGKGRPACAFRKGALCRRPFPPPFPARWCASTASLYLVSA
jgi:hypothetical protein